MGALNIASVSYVGEQASELFIMPAIEAAGLDNIVQVHDVRFQKQLALLYPGKFAFRADTDCSKTNTGGQVEAKPKFLTVNRIYAQNDQCVNDYFEKFIVEQIETGAASGDLTAVEAANQVVQAWSRDRGTDLERLFWMGKEGVTSGNFPDGGSLAATMALFYQVVDGLIPRVIAKLDDSTVTPADKIKQAYTFANDAPNAATVLTALQAMRRGRSALLRSYTKANQVILVTSNIYDGLVENRESFTGSDLSWTAQNEGMVTLRYDGVEIINRDAWNLMQEEGSWGNYAPKTLAIWTTRDAMAIGADRYSRDASVETHYDWKEDKNYVRAKAAIGTEIVDERVMVVASSYDVPSPSASSPAPSPSA